MPSPRDPQSLFADAVRALDNGQLAQAERLASQLHHLFPASAMAVDLLGVIRLRQGQTAAAIALLEAAARLEPGSGAIALHHGMALSQAGRHQEALQSFDRAIAHGHAHARAHCYRADTLRLLGRADEALAGYDAALALEPGSAEIWCLRSNALLDLARPDDARQSCDRALALVPDHAGALVNRGNAPQGDG